MLSEAVAALVRFVDTPPSLGSAPTRVAGLLLRDVVLTRYELYGLMAGWLICSSEPTGCTRLVHRLYDNASGLGARCVSELRRNFRRQVRLLALLIFTSRIGRMRSINFGRRKGVLPSRWAWKTQTQLPWTFKPFTVGE